MKFSVSMQDEVFKLLDEKAKELGVNRSAYITMVLMQKWQSESVLNSFPDIKRTMSELEELIKRLPEKNS